MLQRGEVSINIYNTRAPLLKRRAARHPRPPLSRFFLFLLFLSLSWMSGLPSDYKRDGRAPHRRGLFFDEREALQLHFTFIRDLGAHPSLDRM
jgi:hypothetical protein